MKLRFSKCPQPQLAGNISLGTPDNQENCTITKVSNPIVGTTATSTFTATTTMSNPPYLSDPYVTSGKQPTQTNFNFGYGLYGPQGYNASPQGPQSSNSSATFTNSTATLPPTPTPTIPAYNGSWSSYSPYSSAGSNIPYYYDTNQYNPTPPSTTSAPSPSSSSSSSSGFQSIQSGLNWVTASTPLTPAPPQIQTPQPQFPQPPSVGKRKRNTKTPTATQSQNYASTIDMVASMAYQMPTSVPQTPQMQAPQPQPQPPPAPKKPPGKRKTKTIKNPPIPPPSTFQPYYAPPATAFNSISFQPYNYLPPITTSVTPMPYTTPATLLPYTTPATLLPPPPPPTALPFVPPNHQEYLDDTIAGLAPYKLFPVSDTTPEYATLTELLNPVKITTVQQVVNPDLWARFVNTRKEMLRSKSDDLGLLSNLGLDDKQVVRSAQMSFNYDKDAAVEATPYTDNMALLFHCTRSATSIDPILAQGLDERVGNAGGGLLGRGIYFADNPQKSINYDGGTGIVLVFGVLLGDCLSVDHLPNKNQLVREPEKSKNQKRNYNDSFFDSIVARPASDNEYVIYNRYQCCPLYKINYQSATHMPSSSRNSQNSTASFRSKLPPLAWKPSAPGSIPLPPASSSSQPWPFFAGTIFSQMGVGQQQPQPTVQDAVVDESDDSVVDKLATLANLGFYDLDLNRELLKKFRYNIDQTVNYLLDHGDQQSVSPVQPIDIIDLSGDPDPATPGPSTYSSSLRTSKTAEEPELKELTDQDILDWATDFDQDYLSPPISSDLSAPATSTEMEDCPICCNSYVSNSPTDWNELACTHKLCTACYKQIEITRMTMSGVTHRSIRCPFCQAICGIEVGTCPVGIMRETQSSIPCTGYEKWGSIAITYNVTGTHPLNRTAFLPDNDEGQKVLQLLRTAWDRRLCFTIGTSVTTGQQNVLVWNIHHKTSQSGGVQSYGYPDPSYLDRVKAELRAYGIE
ncbi:uncharacterized protein LOC110863369 isoform X2 [Folsomia candida]|nr:uncharacterized protein LOC110863369 isoform X2 [Folsomia candida]XP_021968356.1 uncharacterized protein LOC110863369 isoform X2 [Folsomia candida]